MQKNKPKNQTQKRKKQHLEICLHEDVQSCLTNGFERYRLVYNALPEINYADIDLSTEFLGKKLNYPFLLSAMTGGTDYAKQINRNLAQVAQKLNIAMCVGSQRAMLENSALLDTFYVRDVAPDILLFANFGAIQLNYGYGVAHCQQLVDAIEADALVLHLNPLHEATQPEGDLNFKGLEKKIKAVVDGLSVPVIVKEVGCGISGEVAQRLYDCGVRIIDVAGAGGTSFPVVEGYRSGVENKKLFGQLGIPTAECIVDVKNVLSEKISVIASGGITNGIESAKACALGADLVGFAGAVLPHAVDSAQEVESFVKCMARALKTTLFSAGAQRVRDLKNKIIKL